MVSSPYLVGSSYCHSQMKKVNISCFCAWKIIGKYIWNLTNPNTIPIITKKTTNTFLFKDPKYKYNDKYANSQNDKHKYDNFMVFGVWNPPKLWYPNIFVPNYAGPWSYPLVEGFLHIYMFFFLSFALLWYDLLCWFFFRGRGGSPSRYTYGEKNKVINRRVSQWVERELW